MLTVAASACDDDKKPAPPAPASATPTAASSAAVATASASGSTSASATTADMPPLSAEAFCVRLFGNIYGDFAKQCTEDDKKSDGYKLAVLVATMPLEECNFVVRDGVAAGRMTFDALAAARCADAAEKTKHTMKGVHLATPDIDELMECNTVVVGKQADGQPCRSSLECKDPLTCIGAHHKHEGTCKPLPTKDGDPCDGAVWKHHDLGHRHRCGPGLACDAPDSKTKDPICRPAIAQGGACVETDQCTEGLNCRAAKCTAAPPVDAGGACDDDADDCRDGLYCKRDKGQKEGKCTEKKAAGQPCVDVFECRGECRKPAGKPDGTCTAICGSG
jgi:hypothetical protein